MRRIALLIVGATAIAAGGGGVAALPIGDPGGGGPIQKIITGSRGSDAVNGSSLNERFDMLEGLDDVRAGAGDDDILGGKDDDLLDGEDGIDEISGDQGADRMLGGKGDDRIRGGREADELLGGPGNDLLRGERENDELFGEDGNDTLWGGGGSDFIRGGPGVDILRGHDPLIDPLTDTAGDQFFFDEGWSVPGSVDEIRDLNGNAATDAIRLTDYDANTVKDGVQKFKRVADNAKTLKAGEVTVVKVGPEVFVRGNTDKDAALELEIRIVGFTGNLSDIFLSL